MSINIYSSRLTRSIVTCRPSIVADEWYDDTCISVLLFDIFHVDSVWEKDV